MRTSSVRVTWPTGGGSRRCTRRVMVEFRTTRSSIVTFAYEASESKKEAESPWTPPPLSYQN